MMTLTAPRTVPTVQARRSPSDHSTRQPVTRQVPTSDRPGFLVVLLRALGTLAA